MISSTVTERDPHSTSSVARRHPKTFDEPPHAILHNVTPSANDAETCVTLRSTLRDARTSAASTTESNSFELVIRVSILNLPAKSRVQRQPKPHSTNAARAVEGGHLLARQKH